MQKISQEISIGNDKKIILSSGQLAPQANASILAQYGKTIVLVTVVMGDVDESKDYFPLSVEFADKLYAGGFVKGGKWVKREMNPSDTSILFGRIIDRSIRPLFPIGFQNEIQIIVTVLSNDKENDVIIPAFTAVSAALAMSNIPFNAPVSAVRVGSIDGSLVLNPSLKDLNKSDLNLLVCSGPAGINMIEAEANIVDNDIALKAIELAKITSDGINSQIVDFAKKYGQEKAEFTPVLPSNELITEVEDQIKDDLATFLKNGADGKHIADEHKIVQKILDLYDAKIKSEEISKNILIKTIDMIIWKAFREQTLKGVRYDHRQLDEIRPLNIEPGILPCTHGSALFQRGLTQAVTITTLSTLADKQYLQDSMGETTKRYIHYYSAAPFSTGQTGRFGRPGRREIGHGALAEKALLPVIPTEEQFPYTIILTSEILSQNGSSSMASTCGSTMSLLDAGVPIKDKVAGISIGMISDKDKYLLLTDIAGIEDHHGDMDFKITGTKTGITAIQLDIKSAGLSLDMIRDTFVASTKARLQILQKMDEVMPQTRPQLSEFAPKIILVRLPEEKIGEIIGSGGKTIKALMEKYSVQIDIDDEGNASISSMNNENNAAAAFQIESMIKEVQIGEEYDGVVTRVENFGAFIEFLPGREALLHVSEMSGGFLNDPSSIIKIGDEIHVKIAGFNDNHQVKLSAPEFKAAHPASPDAAGASDSRAEFRPQRSFDKFGSRGFGKPRPRR